MEVPMSSSEEWVWQGGGWKKKKVFYPASASASNEKTTPASNGSGYGVVAKTRGQAAPTKALSESVQPAKTHSWKVQATTRQPKNVPVVSAPSVSLVVTPTKSNPRFNPTFPSTSARTTNTNTVETPDTAASTPESNHDDMEDLCHVAIPVTNIRMIQTAFGKNADLYTDVLGVDSKSAVEREIRIAYFRRGRQVLEQNQQDAAANTASIADLSVVAKQRFQAVSMAYEILAQPSSKRLYDRLGSLQALLHYALHQVDKEEAPLAQVYQTANETSVSPVKQQIKDEATPKLSPPTIRRRNSFEDRTGTSTARQGRTVGRTPPAVPVATTAAASSKEEVLAGGGGAVRWSEDVEELVYDQHPEERAFKSAAVARTADKIKRKSKKIVLVDNQGEAQEDLVKNLERLDRATTAHPYVSNFLDDVETSLEHIEVGFEEFVKYISDGEDSDHEERGKTTRAVIAKPKLSSRKTPPVAISPVASTEDDQPKRRAQSRVMAAMQAFEKPAPAAALTGEKKQFVTKAPPAFRTRSPVAVPDSINMSVDASENISQDADELFASLMKTPSAVVQNDAQALYAQGLAGNPLLQKARSDLVQRRGKSQPTMSGPTKMDSKLFTNNNNRVKLKKAAPTPSILDFAMPNRSVVVAAPFQEDELGESFLPVNQPKGGPANMVIRARVKKSTRDGDSISAITESTSIPKNRQESKLLSNCVPTLDQVPEADEDAPVTTVSVLNTTMDTDVFNGVEDDAGNPSALGGITVNFLSYFMTYMKNLSNDVYSVGANINTSIENTNRMIFESIIISDDDMKGMLDHLHHETDEDPMTITRAKTF